MTGDQPFVSKTNKLIIGNMNYSSWSFRPWIAMRQVGLGFEEQIVPLFSGGYKEELLRHSPAGQVPIFIHDNTTVWGSVAILEFLADLHPDKELRPVDISVRAHARSIVGEMHSGFTALRAAMPMNMRRTPSAIDYDNDVAADIVRVDEIWSDCRTKYRELGPFLFGAFTIADAMYAPVVSRLQVYQVPVSDVSATYMETMIALDSWQEWAQLAAKEPWTIERVEL